MSMATVFARRFAAGQVRDGTNRKFDLNLHDVLGVWWLSCDIMGSRASLGRLDECMRHIMH